VVGCLVLSLLPGVPTVATTSAPPQHKAVPAIDSDAPPKPELEEPTASFSHPPLYGERLLEAIAADRKQGSAFDPETSVLQPSLTSPTQEVFRNLDGTYTAMVTPTPTRFRDDGAWRDIDLSLTRGANGDITPTASPVNLSVPADPAGGLVRADGLAFGVPSVLEGPRPAGIDGTTAVVNGDGGVSATVQPTADGFDDSLTFATPGTARASYTVAVRVPAGMTVRQTEAGVDFIDRDGAVAAHYGDGRAFDASAAGDLAGTCQGK
jgi:hypothetical protein